MNNTIALCSQRSSRVNSGCRYQACNRMIKKITMLLLALTACCVVSLGGLGGTDAVLQEVDYEAVNYYDGDYVDYDVASTYTAVDDVITGARRLNTIITLRQSPLLLGVYTVRSSDRPVGPTGLSDQSDEAFTRSDRRTDRSVRPRLRPTVCQTSRTDWSDRL